MVTIKGLFDRAMQKIGYIRSKSYEKLWAMAKEWRIGGSSLTNEYENHATVYKAIKAIADNVQQAELKFYNRKTKKEVENNPDLEHLFKYAPNPLMSFNELIEATVIFHRIYGEAFWVYEKSIGQVIGTRNIPAEIWTFSPTEFSEIKDSSGHLIGWKHGTRELGLDQVLHVRDFHPYNSIRGLSPLKPARKIMDIDWQSLLYSKAFFENDATPPFFLGSEQNLTDEQKKQVMEWFNKQHRGVSNSFKFAVLGRGLKPMSVTPNSRDMELLEQKRFNREEIIGMWRVPKSMFSITDDLNYATFIGQKKVFWTDTIQPVLKRIAEEINSQFFEKFMSDVECRWDYSNVTALKEELKDKLESAQRLFGMGVPLKVINEKLELGLPDNIEGADIGYLPFGLVPVGADKEEDPQKEDKPKEDNEGKKSVEFMLDRHQRIWKGFIRLHEPIELKMRKKVSRFLNEQRGRLLKRVSEKAYTKAVKFDFDWKEEENIFAEMMSPLMKESIFRGVEFAKGITGTDISNDILEAKLRSYLSVKITNLSGINERLKNKIEDLLEEGLTQGETVNQLADRIRSFYNRNKDYYALRIARTETTGSLNGGTVQYYEAIGAKTKTWVTAGDEHVRDSHQLLSNQTVGINEKFENGLDYPASDGDPSEVINCRCTLITNDNFEENEQ